VRELSLGARVLLATIVSHGELDMLGLLAVAPADDLSAWIDCLQEVITCRWVIRVATKGRTGGNCYLLRPTPEGTCYVQGHSLSPRSAA
jgi:hypothetical protein